MKSLYSVKPFITRDRAVADGFQKNGVGFWLTNNGQIVKKPNVRIAVKAPDVLALSEDVLKTNNEGFAYLEMSSTTIGDDFIIAAEPKVLLSATEPAETPMISFTEAQYYAIDFIVLADNAPADGTSHNTLLASILYNGEQFKEEGFEILFSGSDGIDFPEALLTNNLGHVVLDISSNVSGDYKITATMNINIGGNQPVDTQEINFS